jgi:hypothetical protein
MASLQRAILILWKLNLRGIPQDIRDTLRQWQDVYSEELDLDGLDTSSQGSTKPGDRRKTILKKGEGKYDIREANLEPSHNTAGQNRDPQAGIQSKMMRSTKSTKKRGTRAIWRMKTTRRRIQKCSTNIMSLSCPVPSQPNTWAAEAYISLMRWICAHFSVLFSWSSR